MIRLIAVLCLALAVSTVALGQAKKNLKEEVQQSEKTAQVFHEIMDTPDKVKRKSAHVETEESAELTPVAQELKDKSVPEAVETERESGRDRTSTRKGRLC